MYLFAIIFVHFAVDIVLWCILVGFGVGVEAFGFVLNVMLLFFRNIHSVDVYFIFIHIHSFIHSHYVQTFKYI